MSIEFWIGVAVGGLGATMMLGWVRGWAIEKSTVKNCSQKKRRPF